MLSKSKSKTLTDEDLYTTLSMKTEKSSCMEIVLFRLYTRKLDVPVEKFPTLHSEEIKCLDVTAIDLLNSIQRLINERDVALEMYNKCKLF